MRRLYRFLGFDVGRSCPGGCRREESLLMSIIYGTNTEFGFDYLRDNMAWQKEDLARFLIMPLSTYRLDLIDEARTPLIISDLLRHYPAVLPLQDFGY